MTAEQMHTPTDAIAKERADWLLDAVATATQNRMFLRGEPEYDAFAGDAILLNGAKAIRVAITRTAASSQERIAQLEAQVAEAVKVIGRMATTAEAFVLHFVLNELPEGASRQGQSVLKQVSAARAFIDAPDADPAPDGDWKLVPVEPTPEMLAATLPMTGMHCDPKTTRLAEMALMLLEPKAFSAETHRKGLDAARGLIGDYRAMLAAAPDVGAAK